MTTVDKEFADKIIAGRGFYDNDDSDELGDNPRCVKIIEYTNMWNKLSYGLVFKGERDKYVHTDYVQNPHIYWEYAE